MTNMPNVTIYTDGSFIKERHGEKINPGGYAGLMECGSYRQIVYGDVMHTTINKMELTAVLACLRLLTTACNVHIVSDSQYVVFGITRWLNNWVRNDWISTHKRKEIANVELWQEIYMHLQYHHVTAEWQRGHNGHEQNEIADWFAQVAARGLYAQYHN